MTNSGECDRCNEHYERGERIAQLERVLSDICEHPTLGRVRATGINRVRNYTFTPQQLENALAVLNRKDQR